MPREPIRCTPTEINRLRDDVDNLRRDTDAILAYVGPDIGPATGAAREMTAEEAAVAKSAAEAKLAAGPGHSGGMSFTPGKNLGAPPPANPGTRPMTDEEIAAREVAAVMDSAAAADAATEANLADCSAPLHTESRSEGGVGAKAPAPIASATPAVIHETYPVETDPA